MPGKKEGQWKRSINAALTSWADERPAEAGQSYTITIETRENGGGGGGAAGAAAAGGGIEGRVTEYRVVG